jgi:enoyl-[acyl-carrier-protein] reductase (NADH)
MEYSMRIFASNAAKHDITCNVVIPGAVKTDAWQRVGEHRGTDLLNILSKRVPLGQAPMDPTHIGDVVSFLANPLLGGRYITGQSIPVDAGLTTLR